MQRISRLVLGTSVAALLVAGPLAYAWFWQGHVRNFRVIREGVLYRSGQMTLWGLKRVVRDYGIRTVISLRDSYRAGDPPPDRAEEEYCKAEEIGFCRISPKSWWGADLEVPADEAVRLFRSVMDDPRNYPVLMHCFGGIHRTGAFCAIYRMEYDRWTHEEALDELRASGYRHLDDEWDILTFLDQYRPRWQARRGPDDQPAVRPGVAAAHPVKRRKKHPEGPDRPGR